MLPKSKSSIPLGILQSKISKTSGTTIFLEEVNFWGRPVKYSQPFSPTLNL